MTTPDDPGYEAARAELREIVGRLESGGGSLEESLALWERGEHLADVCRQWLDGAGARLDAAIAEHDADDANDANDADGADGAPRTGKQTSQQTGQQTGRRTG